MQRSLLSLLQIKLYRCGCCGIQPDQLSWIVRSTFSYISMLFILVFLFELISFFYLVIFSSIISHQQYHQVPFFQIISNKNYCCFLYIYSHLFYALDRYYIMAERYGVECQRLMMQAIQQYTDRHNTNPNINQIGANDLNTLAKCNPASLIQTFNSSLQSGLTSAQVKANGAKFGVNQYKKRKRISLFEIFCEAISDQMLIILIIAAIVSIVVQYFAGEDKELFWVDGVSILIAVAICSIVATVSNYQKQLQFAQLDQMTEQTYNYEVMRDGKRTTVHRSSIVPGDMILVSNGLQIPADCLLYRAVNIHVNESAVTGESHELEKNTFEKCMNTRMDLHGATPYMISGANVVTGQGIMMAVVVGKDSQAGKNFELIFSQDDDDDNQTPLEKKLEDLGTKIGHFGIISALIIFIVLIIRLLIEQLTHQGFKFNEFLTKAVSYLIIAVTIIVVAVPEGLPLAVTLTLAYSMKAMYEDKILVRQLASCQTMGAATYICSDKTGTITQNKMNVMHIVNTAGVPITDFTKDKIHPAYLQNLATGIFHNSSSVVDTEKGAQTEIALLKMARQLTGQNEVDVRNKVGIDGYFKRLPFDSSRKRMTTGVNVNGQNILYMSGASQQILQACKSIQSFENNQILNITPQQRNQIIHQLESMARRGLRTVSFAYKAVDPRSVNQPQNKNDVVQEVEKSGFTLLGVFGIQDPPRPESKQSIASCQRAGIKVLMVTGDNKVTATSIAKQVGIISSDGKGKIMEASQLISILQKRGLLKQELQSQSQQSQNSDSDSGKKSEQGSSTKRKGKKKGNSLHKVKKVKFNNQAERQQFQNLIGDLVVLARSKPQHKYILVDGINRLGHVVGVTGDGANDAPALMRADIGLAMGITGTQVAKNASDIVLLDDNFKSIVRAVVWGRNVYLSIRKFLQFQLTVNLVAVCVTLASAVIIKQSVFTAVQMLWLNLIMDSLAALALATQPPNADQLLRQRPNTPDESFITKTMMKHIIGQAILQVVILMILLFLGQNFIPEFKDDFDSKIGADLKAKYYNGFVEGTVADGKDYSQWFQKYHNSTRHFTYIFNTFVFLQIFNFLCCRKVKDELNIFKGIGNSGFFIIIVGIIFLLQIFIINFGGRFFQLYRYGGLAPAQWLTSILFGMLSLPVSFLLRLLPLWKPEMNEYEREFYEKEDM